MSLDTRVAHPAWCDPTRCTADTPAPRAEHRSTPITTPQVAAAVVSASVSLVRAVDELDGAAVLLSLADEPLDERQFAYHLRPSQARRLRDALARAYHQVLTPGLRPWNGVDHPHWCDVDRCVLLCDDDRGRPHPVAVEHLSRPIDCNPDHTKDTRVAVYLRQPANGTENPTVHLEVTTPGDLQAFPLLTEQVAGLRDGFSRLG